MTTQKIIIATIFGTRGNDDPEYVGIVQEVSGADAMEEAALDLTDKQITTIRRSQEAYRRDLEADFDVIEQAQTRIRAASHIYQTSMAWLETLRKAAVEAQEDAEHAAWEERTQAEKAAIMADLAKQDTELGPRDFIRVERKNLTAREKYSKWAKNPKLCKLHKTGCRLLPDMTRVAGQDRLRIGEAIDYYVKGAESCGVCTPDEAMAANESFGQRVRDIRQVRESAVVPMTRGMLQGALNKADVTWWRRGQDGATIVALNDDVPVESGELVLGWRAGDSNYAVKIPVEYRDLLFTTLGRRQWWTVRWVDTKYGYEYLAVGLLTMAQRRTIREAWSADK
jgi:hypothetical protein